MSNPFDIAEPLMIGFSGGRTSGYQLWRFLEHFSHKLPAKCLVEFANTGDEDRHTLDFVERVAIEWNVNIVWLEYRFDPFPRDLLADKSFIELRQRQFANRKDKQLRNEVASIVESAGFPDEATAIRQGRESMNGRHTYAIVNYGTASRNHEPYDMMLLARAEYRQSVKGLPPAIMTTPG